MNKSIEEECNCGDPDCKCGPDCSCPPTKSKQPKRVKKQREIILGGKSLEERIDEALATIKKK